MPQLFDWLRRPTPEDSGRVAECHLPKLEEYQGVDFEQLLSNMPPKIEFGDKYLAALVIALDQAAIGPIEMPLSQSALVELSSKPVRQTISIVTPTNLREGASLDEYSIPLPTKAVVSAPEISDWANGRCGQVCGDGREMSSRDRIRRYARLPADTAPPVQGVTVYVHPQGSMLWVLQGDGAHRVCAAKRRRDPFIRARDVTVVLLEA